MRNSVLNRIIAAISAIFMPIINIMTAAGITKGFLALFVSLGWIAQDSGTYLICNAIADAFFYFLPVFIAFTAAEQFKCDKFTAVVVAGVLLYPQLTQAFDAAQKINFAGIPVTKATYPSSVLPILMAVGFLHFIERFWKRVIPEIISGFLVPLLSIIVTSMVTLTLFGPMGTWFGDVLASGYTYVYDWNPYVSGFFLGGLIQIMVIFGFHWSLVPIVMLNIALYGEDTILPFIGAAAMAQGGAALAVAFRVQDSACKSRILSAVISAVFGVTEPAMFGVNLPLKKPMAAVCAGGAIGGALTGFTGAHAIAFAFPGLPTLPVYFGDGFWGFFGTCVVGFVLGFAFTMFMKLDTTPIEK